MIQTEENGKNPLFGSDLDHWAQIRADKFFFKNLAPSVTSQLSSCTISEKTNDPILRKHTDGWIDRRKDGRE